MLSFFQIHQYIKGKLKDANQEYDDFSCFQYAIANMQEIQDDNAITQYLDSSADAARNEKITQLADELSDLGVDVSAIIV